MNIEQHHIIYMNIAKEIAKLSKCVSFKVGVVLVKNGRIISTGYNGTPKGFLNCEDLFPNYNIQNISQREAHHKFSENYEIHAELNSIIFAARNGISIEGADMYSTLHPCNNCLKAVCNSGIKNIYYEKEYDQFKEDEKIIKMLNNCGVNLIKLN